MENTTEAQEPKLAYEEPAVELLGRMEELTGSGGSNNDDGWGHTKLS